MITAEELARMFHEAYERLAPGLGYETRVESAVPWEHLPERNKTLMIAVAGEVMEQTGMAEEIRRDEVLALIHRLVPQNWRERERRREYRKAYEEAEQLLGCLTQ